MTVSIFQLWSCNGADCIPAVDFYITLFQAIVKNSETAHGPEGYYFIESEEHTMKEVATAISQALVELGLGTNPEPSSYTDEEKTAFFGVCLLVHRRLVRC